MDAGSGVFDHGFGVLQTQHDPPRCRPSWQEIAARRAAGTQPFPPDGTRRIVAPVP